MRTDRRGFLRWTAAAAALLAARRGGAVDAPVSPETALDIHRATCNTRLGAVGTRVRAAFRDARQPFKVYPGRERVALPGPAWDTGRPLFEVARGYAPARGFAGEPIDRAALSRLLFLTNGVTRRTPRLLLRAAPSAGALYAGEVYVVAERVEGVSPGVYYYGVDAHELVRLRQGRLLAEVAAALEASRAAAGAAAAVLLTNVFARYRVRYANRGYRYALIDSGHIGENLRLAAAELGLADAAPLRWEDDRLNALLGVDGREEAVCALHLVGGAGAGAVKAAGEASRALVEQQRATPEKVASGLAEPERYHEATKLVWREATPADGPVPAHSDSAVSGWTPEREGTAVHTAIRMRRSAASFEAEPMSRADLLQLLALAQGVPALRRAGGIDLYAVANRVAELPAGLYRYVAAKRALEPRRGGALAEPLVRAALGQPKSGEAAAALIGVARIDETELHSGARGYRDLLLEAGAVAQRLYIGAEALGLAARNLAAFYDDEIDALLGLDGEREVAVHLTAVGPGD